MGPTERAEAEAALRASEQRFRAFVTARPDMVYRMNPDWSEMWQLDGEGLLVDTAEPSAGWRERYIHPDDLPALEAAISSAVRTKTVFELEHRVRRADGGLGWVFTRAVPILNAAGEIVEWLGAGNDVTDRVFAQEALRAREAGYRALFETMDEGYAVVEVIADSAGRWHDFRFLEANPACMAQTGLPYPVGQTATELIGTPNPRWAEMYGQVAETGESVRFEESELMLDRVFDLNVCRLGGPGSRRVGVLFTNITERKNAEAALRATAARDAFRVELTDSVREAADPIEAQGIAMRVLGDHLGASRVMYGEADAGSSDYFINHREYCRDAAVPTSLGTHRWDSFGPNIAAEMRAGRTLVVDDVAGDRSHSANELAAYQGVGVGAYVAVPLVREGQIVAYLGVNHMTAHAWTPQEVALVEETAERTWAAVESARAQAALRDSEERLRLVVDGARDYAIFMTDAEGRITDWYAGAEAVFGYAAAEVRGRDAAIVFTPEDRANGVPEAELAMARKHGLAPDIRWHQCKAGGRVFIDGRTVPLRNGDGSLRGYIKIGLDATRRHAAEELLRQSEERFRQFAEYSSEVIWIRDAETMQFEYVSPAIADIYGVAPEEFKARHNDLKAWAEILHPSDRAHALNAFRQVREGKRVTHEFRIERPGAGTRWIRDTDFPLFDANGRVQRIAGIGQDVTDLKRAEAEVAESEGRLRTLMEGIPQLVWRSADEGLWTWASPQWAAFTGQVEATSLGLGWLDVVHPDDHATTMRAWAQARGNGLLEAEYRVLRASDGAWVWHHTRSVPVRGADGEIVEWLGTSTDVQDLRELQERQGVLVGELQHRTRNLIGVVRSMADKTLRASTDLPDFRERFGHRMQALSRVQGLLSRLADRERVTFDTLIGAELAAVDAFDDPRVELDGPTGVPLRSGTVQTLALALHELATNAVKYGALAQAGARLKVDWRVLSPEGEPQSKLLIQWRETGVTMAAGDAPRGSGQGRELIERALPYQLDAQTTYQLGPDGVDCSIAIPISSQWAAAELIDG